MSRFESAAESLSPTDRPGLESLLIEASNVLHPCHHVCVDLKFSLAQLYGRDRPQDQRLLMEEGERKKRICLDILQVMDKVTPGRWVIISESATMNGHGQQFS